MLCAVQTEVGRRAGGRFSVGYRAFRQPPLLMPRILLYTGRTYRLPVRNRRDEDEDCWTGRTTPREIGAFLESIERGTAVSAARSVEMKNILLRQQLGVRRIPHYLTVPVAHKTGDGPTVANDAGLVYAPSGPIVISLFATAIKGPYGETEDQIGQPADEIRHGRTAQRPN